jgi:GNAT superfamily N-acetyltransferase
MTVGTVDPMCTIRAYRLADRPGVRSIYRLDEFARPRLMQKYPGMSAYLADSMSYYTDCEAESTFVAQLRGEIVGALLGAVDARCAEMAYERQVRPALVWRCLTGRYGWPGWLGAEIRTEWAARGMQVPKPDCCQYPAHLHIGVHPHWRRQGIGTGLMDRFEQYLLSREIPGYHLYASSFHPQGVAFYRKRGLTELSAFQWRFHDGTRLRAVTEIIFGKRLIASAQQ